ncbi:hypothetical protein [Enterococcus sp. LJL90]
MKKVLEKNWGLEFAFFSIFLLAIFSKNSPLFSTNDWVDANAFLTVGKSMFNGLVPYKDIFEQKGPYLYFVYGISSFFKLKSFLGVYLLECIAMATNLICVFKILKLYLPKNTSLILTLFFPIFILNYYFFRQGGSAEELCMPLLLILMYQVLTRIHSLKIGSIIKFDKRVYFLQGLFVSIVFLTKFSLLGPWIAFYLFLVVYLIIKKDFHELLHLVLFSALGFCTGTIPWFIYFVVNGALNDFFNVYIFINSSSYNQAAVTITQRIIFIMSQLIANIKFNLLNLFFLVPIFPIIFMLKSLSKNFAARLMLSLIVFSTGCFMYIGMRTYEYYFLFFTCYSIFGLLLLGKIFGMVYKDLSSIFYFSTSVIIPLAVIISTCICLANNSNIEESLLFPYNRTVRTDSDEPNQTAQQLFSEYMHSKSGSPTLLNYGFLDGGFYLAADILPTEKHFELQNLDHSVYSENYNSQNEAITQKRVEFFVIETQNDYSESDLEELGYLQNYDVAMSHSQSRDQRYYTYWLFELKK